MKLTTKGRYAVMAMADLASNTNVKPISLAEISVRQNISLAYLEQIFIKLKKNKLVKSARGANGGYILDIQKTRSLAFLFISHDLSVIEAICDRVVIMKNGEIVEEGTTENIFKKPENSYTKELLNSRPGA